MSDIETNKRLAREYLEKISAGDADGVAAMFAEDGKIVVESDTMLPPEVPGPAAIRELIMGIGQFFPETGLKIMVDELTAEDDRVSVLARSDAIHASGKPYRNRYHFLLRFRDGKIVASHEYLDSLHLNDVFFDGARKPA